MQSSLQVDLWIMYHSFDVLDISEFDPFCPFADVSVFERDRAVSAESYNEPLFKSILHVYIDEMGVGWSWSSVNNIFEENWKNLGKICINVAEK